MTNYEIIADYFGMTGWGFTCSIAAILLFLWIVGKARQYNSLLAENENRSASEHSVPRPTRHHCPGCGDTVSSSDWDAELGQCDSCCHEDAQECWAERERLERAAEEDRNMDILASKIAEKVKSLNSGV